MPTLAAMFLAIAFFLELGAIRHLNRPTEPILGFAAAIAFAVALIAWVW